jgi:hypothetical protein
MKQFNMSKKQVDFEKEYYKKQFTASEIIDGLSELYKQRKEKLKTKEKKLFSLAEFNFLLNLISDKNKDFVTISVFKYISDRGCYGLGIENTASMRRVLFFKRYFINKGNATKCAIDAGYKPKSAKQSGYRTLKWIQKKLND